MFHTMCTTCGREVAWIHSSSLSLVEVNQKAKCCSNPHLYWITGGKYSKNSLHREHVRNTRRNNVNQD